ncbi:MAG: hypothetical protein PVF15_01235 [Candidatus Bathyarchaeota archaeon]
MTEIAVLPQKVVDREIVILKTRIDLATAKLLMERAKRKFFVRLGLLKPKLYEIRFISADRYYEPYIVVGGKYTVDYCKRYIFITRVKEKVQCIFILGKKFRPEPSSGVVRLEGEGHFHYENQGHFILDRMGREVKPEQMAYAAYAEEQLENLEEIKKKLREAKISPHQVIEFLRSKIVRRPSDIERITKEWFEVNQHTMVYIPVYELTFQNINTGKVANVKINGITGKIISQRKK